MNYRDYIWSWAGALLLTIATMIWITAAGRVTINLILPKIQTYIEQTSASNKVTLTAKKNTTTPLIPPATETTTPTTAPIKIERQESVTSEQQNGRTLAPADVETIQVENNSADISASSPSCGSYAELAHAGAGPAYCSNEVLKITEQKLNDTYKKTKGLLTEDQAINLRTSERQWIKDRNERCKKYTVPETQYCLAQEASSRIVWLENYKH